MRVGLYAADAVIQPLGLWITRSAVCCMKGFSEIRKGISNKVDRARGDQHLPCALLESFFALLPSWGMLRASPFRFLSKHLPCVRAGMCASMHAEIGVLPLIYLGKKKCAGGAGAVCCSCGYSENWIVD